MDTLRHGQGIHGMKNDLIRLQMVRISDPTLLVQAGVNTENQDTKT